MQIKAAWMETGTIVLAGGKKGKITAVNPVKMDGVDYVEYLNVKIDGTRRSQSFAPSEVKQYGYVQQELFSHQP